MPRNRQDVDRQVKLNEILDVAEDILRSGGYEALSPSAVARKLGLARAVIYWYFPTKDDLFTAVVGRIFATVLSRPPVTDDFMRRIQWGVDRLAELQPLNAALHDRARHSEVAAKLETTIQEELCNRLREVLRPHVEPDRLDRVSKVIVVFVEGLLSNPLSARERRDMLRFLVGQLV